jgi:hypothetical protein
VSTTPGLLPQLTFSEISRYQLSYQLCLAAGRALVGGEGGMGGCAQAAAFHRIIKEISGRGGQRRGVLDHGSYSGFP